MSYLLIASKCLFTC